MSCTNLSQDDCLRLLSIAEDTIAYGLEAGRYRPIEEDDYRIRLGERGASFVTLYLHGQLRGCIGNLQASRPLIEDVAHNAYAAAFKDPRFEPVNWSEFLELQIEISVLSPLQVLQFDNETGLLDQLRPGIDGVVFEAGQYRATFLPKVWEHIPAKQAFLGELKNKAGLKSDFWSDNVNVQRYTTHTFSSRELKEARN
ncbi:MAG: AmmeMemoRadiSam system protein A [Gammaproteobacteria bacterium]|nr:AmmeMemoRadiSam system protein A [Gammaproteobacteria bacterium]